MKRIIWTATLAALVVQVGCGGGKKDELADSASPKKVAVNPAPLVTDAKDLASKPTGRGAAPDSNAAADARDEMVPLSALNLANPTKPEEVVGAFLDGMRTGNAKVIEALLSTRARQEIKSKGLDIAPIGSPQAAFEIGKAQQIDPKDPNVMLVTSNWLEPGPKGAPVSEYEVVWALVKENDGWRICEMAVDTHIEGEEVQVVNFENLSDLARDPVAERTAALPNGPAPIPGNVPPPGSVPLPAGLPSGNLPPAGLPSNSLPPLPPSGSGLPALPGSPAGR